MLIKNLINCPPGLVSVGEGDISGLTHEVLQVLPIQSQVLEDDP